MDIEKLRHFVAVAEGAGMISVADERGMSQSGLSRSIGYLEKELSSKLFTRAAGGLVLNKSGQTFLLRARLIVNEFDRSVAEIGGPESCIVGITENFSHYIIPQVVSSFTARKPNAQMIVKAAGVVDLLQALQDARLDMVLGLVGPMQRDPDLRVQRFENHRLCVVGRAGHPLIKHTLPVTIDQLSQARWAIHTRQAFHVDFCQSFIAAKTSAPIQAVRSDSLALIRGVVLRDDLLTILPYEFAKIDLEAGTLAVLNCDPPGEPTTAALITRRDGVMNPSQMLAARLIRKGFATPVTVASR